MKLVNISLSLAFLMLVGCGSRPATFQDGVTYSVNSAPTTCANGAQQCVGTQVEACANGLWTQGENCANSNSSCSLLAGKATCVATVTQEGNVVLPSISLTAPRGGSAPVMALGVANTTPSLMRDGNLRMWWQGTVNGVTRILYAEASDLNGPWHGRSSTASNSADDALLPSSDPNAFDATSVGSPKVVYAANNLYMYYEGTRGGRMSIGVALSLDGVTWTRANNGQAIVTSVGAGAGGVKQPSVVAKGGKFYLLYSDTNGSGNTQGAGLYVMRATDPLFTQNVEELTAKGFAAVGTVVHSGYALLPMTNADWFYVDVLDTFGIAVGNPNDTTLYLFDQALEPVGSPLIVPVGGNGGPGIVTRPDRHAIPHAISQAMCSAVPFDFVRATGPASTPNSWELAHTGRDLTFTLPCAEVPVARVYDNAQVYTANAGISVVTTGSRVLVDVAATANAVTRNAYVVSDEIYGRIPQVAHVTAGMGGYTGVGVPGGLYDLVANLFLPLGCGTIATANASTLTLVSSQQYQALKFGPALFCTP